MGKRQVTTTLLKIVALVVVAAILKSCVLWGKPIEGTIIDERTKSPLSGVHIVAVWQGNIFMGSHVCVHVESTKTDTHGHFVTNGWFQESQNGESMGDGWISLYFYKSRYDESMIDQPGGYKLTKRDPSGAYFMKPYEATSEERIHSLLQLSSNLSCYKHDVKSTFEAQRDIYREARALGPAKLVDSIKRAAITAYYPIAEGYDDDLVDALARNDSYLEGQLR